MNNFATFPKVSYVCIIPSYQTMKNNPVIAWQIGHTHKIQATFTNNDDYPYVVILNNLKYLVLVSHSSFLVKLKQSITTNKFSYLLRIANIGIKLIAIQSSKYTNLILFMNLNHLSMCDYRISAMEAILINITWVHYAHPLCKQSS